MTNTFPLTQTQTGIYLEWAANKDSLQYNVPQAFILPQDIDLPRFLNALRSTIDLYPSLRIRFKEESGGISQYVDSEMEIPIRHCKCTEAEARDACSNFMKPFDLLTESLCRFAIFETPTKTYFALDIHHIIYDGTSGAMFFNTLNGFYENGTAPAPEEASFEEYAKREEAMLNSAEYAEVAEYYRNRFQGKSMTVPQNVMVHSRKAADSALSAEPFALQNSLKRSRMYSREKIDDFCASHSIHPNILLMGAFGRALGALAGETEVVFTTINHGRQDRAFRNTFGATIKLLPILCSLNKDTKLIDYLNSCKAHKVGIYPFTHFCRDTGMTPAFSFAYQDGTVGLYETLAGEKITRHTLSAFGASEYPLLQIYGLDDKFLFLATCQPGKYSTEFLELLIDMTIGVLDNFVNNPEKTLGEIPLLAKEDETAVLELSKGVSLEYDASKTFQDLFAERAAAQPNDIALVDCENSMTYAELARQSDAVAAVLRDAGLIEGKFAGVMLPRRNAFVLSIIAVQKCGAGYIPMDSEYPAERLEYMLENSEAPILVTTHELFDGKGLKYNGRIVFLDECDLTAANSSFNSATPSTPAYMIYTSGSTGKPKGVVLSNRSLAAFIAWYVKDCGLDRDSVNACHPSFSFDASVGDLFPTLAAGGQLHILKESIRQDLTALHEYIVSKKVNGMTISTQMGLTLLNTYPELPLKYMMLGGEKMLPFAKTKIRIFNGYGPTEFTVCSSYQLVDQSIGGDIPIGRPVPNSYSLIVDKLGQCLPWGLPGELALVGPQLSEGYWRLPERTAQSFTPCPALPGQKMYRTGDLARYNDEKTLDYLGRIDFQVKLRGFRIEIGEIEHTAASVNGVGAVAAEVREVGGTKHLVLYYEGNVDEKALKSQMSRSLTSYMVPDFYVAMDKLPLTPNGKINRKQLPLPQVELQEIVTPQNDNERELLAMVVEELGISELGVTHDLLKSGLNSLGGMALLAKIHKRFGVGISVKELLAEPTVRALAKMLSKEKQASTSQKTKRAKRAWYPLTESQRGIYVDCLRNPETTQYNISSVFCFANTDAQALADAAAMVLNAHPALKIRFGENKDDVVQLRNDDDRIDVTVERIDAEPDDEFFAKLQTPFALKNEALARAKIVASPSTSYLFIDIHHIIFDGVSAGIVLKEIIDALNGIAPQPEAYTLFDAAMDERDYLESETLDEDAQWFANYLNDTESTFFADSTDGTDFPSGTLHFAKTRMKQDGVIQRCRALSVTPNDYFLTVFTELLKRICREKKIQIATVTSGRTNLDLSAAIGMFVRTLPFCGQSEAKTLEEAVKATHRSMSDLLERERHPFTRLAESLGVQPGILFAFEGGLFQLPQNVSIKQVSNGTAKTPLAMTVTPVGDEFELQAEYDASRYSAKEMNDLVAMYRTLAENLLAEDVLENAPLLTQEETQKTLAFSKGKTMPYDESQTFMDLFLAQAKSNADRKAVVDCEGSFTYAELNQLSDKLAAHLAQTGLKPGCFAGVMLPRRRSFVLSFIAVQKCGAGYIPIDPEYPSDRIAYILANSDAPVLISTRNLFNEKHLDFNGKTIFIDDIQTLPHVTFANLARPELPAYMIYTSGSTGKPKGVVLPHRALRALLEWTSDLLDDNEKKVHVALPSFSFDASIIDLFTPLAKGGELHVLSETTRNDLAGINAYVREHHVDSLATSTQFGMALANAFPDMPLKNMIVGGEKLLPFAKTNIRVFNGYGPTEFTVMSSAQLVDQEQEGDIPIGQPCPNSYSLVIDRYGHPLPLGFPGELALAGQQIADGYWKLPERTAQSFVKSRELDDMRMYKTGDLVKYNSEGSLNYLGRLDFQVKLRGFRIEIGEIENVTAAFKGIKSCAAEIRQIGDAKHLVLYYEGDADEAALKAHLQTYLTSYMVPDYFERMQKMPLTPNGKINRKMLPTPNTAVSEEFVPAANDTERIICEAYAKALNMERFSAAQDFFLSGGTSLLGITAVLLMQKNGLQQVQYGDIFKHKSPKALAAFLTGETTSSNTNDSTQANGFDFGAYDYRAIDTLLQKTRHELFKGFATRPIGNVLLTGATGYLGIHILKYILSTSNGTVYTLIRPKRNVTPEKRIALTWVYYFGEQIPKDAERKIQCIPGDITDDNLQELLSDFPIDTVINCAALVKHYIADDALDRINVHGVENLIAYCEKSWARLIQASTYSIGGTIPINDPTKLDEHLLYIGQHSDNDYVRTKFLAERAVLQHIAEGTLKGKIMRLGNLMGRESDGEFQMNLPANAFVNSLKSYRALGAFPLVGLPAKIEMSPIDRVAEAIVLLSGTPDGMVVFHPFNTYQLDLGAILGTLNQYGFPIDYVSQEEFAAHVEALRNDPERAKYLQGVLHYTAHMLDGQRMTEAVNNWTTTVLYRLGFRWKPSADGYLMKFYEMLDGLGVFD
ncbi:MAG: amino acid adenylation domain-containing protein [Lentisphaeria bacterium]|nr:amino acid adenylation domain-containing protein [Lentisphaeria bacterium]